MLDGLMQTLGVWYWIILNMFGVIAIICKILEYQVKKRSTMYILVTIASLCWTAYFAFYGNLISSITCALGALKFLVFMKRDTCKWARSIIWLYAFLALQTGVVVFTSIKAFSWLSIFTILAGYVGIFAYFVTDPRKYRLVSFVHMALWVINSSIYFYPVALASDSFSTISCAVAIYRFDLSKKAREKIKEKQKSQDV